jgi:nitrogen regulatory protein PII
MSSDGETTKAPVYQITCIIQRGKGDRIIKAMIKAGARGGTVFFARGTGTRANLGLLGLAIVPEKEVIQVICKEDEKDRIFQAVVKAGKLDIPGMGIAFVKRLEEVAGGNF